jgi:flagellar basal-body rod protein FlgB
VARLQLARWIAAPSALSERERPRKRAVITATTLKISPARPITSDAMSLVDPTQQLLEAAMRGSWLRQTALSNNIANSETPNYRPQEVDFESTLQTAMEGGSSPEEVEFSAHEVAGEAGPNGSGVSIDQESAKLAENGLDYEALTQIASTRNSIIKSAIGIL